MKKRAEKVEIRTVSGEDQRIDFSTLPYEELQNLTELHLYSETMPSELPFTITFDNELAGELLLKSIRWYNRKAQISIFVKEKFRKQGIAESALKFLLDYVFNTMNFYRLEAEVVSYNPAGQALFEKFGFKKEGVFRESKFFNGKFEDTYSYGLLAREFQQLCEEKGQAGV